MSLANTTTLPAGFPTLAIPSSIDYTSKDWTSLVQSMLAYAGQAMPDWNTGSEGDFGVMMIELFAYMGDILSFYGDRLTQEAYLPTATQRQSLLNIATALGYIASNGAPSSGTVTLVTANPGASALISAGTQFVANPTDAVSQSIVFEANTDIVVPGNGGTATITVTQGVTYTMVPIGQSTGLPGQDIILPDLGVISGSIQVYVQTVSGTEEWQPISFLLDAGPDDEDFTTYVDSSGQTHVEFGDGVNGLIPAIGLNIYATYVVGVGSAGNLQAGAVNAFVNPIDGVTIQIGLDGVTPITSAMTGGADPESNDQIRVNAAQAYQTQYRAVSVADFAALALNVPGVLMSNAVGNHSTSVSLYVLGPNYSVPGPDLVDAILDYFEDLTLAGVSVSVVPPSLIPIDVGTISNMVQLVVRDGYIQQAVVNNVITALTNFLSPPNVSFGQLINVSDLYQVILAVEGVSYVIIPVFTREDQTQTDTTSIQLRPGEIATPGMMNISASGGIS